MCGDFTWMVSDCEELSGGYSQEMMGWVIRSIKNQKAHPNLSHPKTRVVVCVSQIMPTEVRDSTFG